MLLYLLKSSSDNTQQVTSIPQLLPQEHIDAMEPMERTRYFADHSRELQSSFPDFDGDPLHHPELDDAYRKAYSSSRKHLVDQFPYLYNEDGVYIHAEDGDEHYTFERNLGLDHDHHRHMKRLAFDIDDYDPNSSSTTPLQHVKLTPHDRTAEKLLERSPRTVSQRLIGGIDGYKVSPQTVLRLLTEDLGHSHHEALEAVMQARKKLRAQDD